MDGKRFVAGLAGGLLLALVVVGTAGYTSGFIPTTPGSYAANPPPTQTQMGASSTASSSTTTSVTNTEAAAATGSSQGTTTYTAVSSVMSSTVGSGSASSARTESQSTQPSYSTPGVNGGATSAGLSPSRLDSIARQPALVDGLVFLPILVALILGALLYRASGRAKGNAETQPGAG